MSQKVCLILLMLFGVFGSGCTRQEPNHSSFKPIRTEVRFAAAKPDAPSLKRLKNGHYQVLQPWTVKLNGRVWKIQKGYRSNGITAPQWVKKSLGDGIDYPETWAAVFHDWLFTQPGMTRALADRTFLDLMHAYGIPREKRDLMYSSVAIYSISKSFR